MSENVEPKRTEGDSAENEHNFHHYKGNFIPGAIHLMWVTFWIIAIVYTLTWLIPAMQTELVSPP